MSSIQERAKLELDRINFGEEDTQAMLRILRIFFGTWDSGGAVSVAGPVLARLIEGKPLAPLTGEDDEWIDRSEMNDGPLWQNVRMSTVFKNEHYCYDIDDPSRMPIKFPYSGYETTPRAPIVAELTPEQQKAFEEEWSKPAAGHIVWNPNLSEPCTVIIDPGPAIGEHLAEIDAGETAADIRTRIRDDVARLCGMITHLEAQLEAEGAHTEAANAEIERLNRAEPIWRYQRKEGWGDIWRKTAVDPATPGFFETPDNWTVERI